MVKDVFVWMDMQELMVSAKPLDLQQIIQLNQSLWLAPPIQSWLMVNVFVTVVILWSTVFASNQANVDQTVTIMVWDSVFVAQDSTKQLTEVVWPEQHVHHQVQEMTKENVFVMLVWPSMETIVLNAHLEPSLTMLHKNVFMSVDKILLIIPPNKNVFVLQDMELLTRFVQNAPQTTLFKTIIVLLVQLTLFFLPLQKSVNVLMDFYWAKMEFVSKNVQITKSTMLNLEFVTVLLVLEESVELVKSAQVEKHQVPMDHVEDVESTNNLLMDNVFVFQATFQTLLKFVPNVVTLMEPSWSMELVLLALGT